MGFSIQHKRDTADFGNLPCINYVLSTVYNICLVRFGPFDREALFWCHGENSVENQPDRLWVNIRIFRFGESFDPNSVYPKDHWTLKTGYFEDPTPAIQVQILPLEGPRSLG